MTFFLLVSWPINTFSFLTYLFCLLMSYVYSRSILLLVPNEWRDLRVCMEGAHLLAPWGHHPVISSHSSTETWVNSELPTVDLNLIEILNVRYALSFSILQNLTEKSVY